MKKIININLASRLIPIEDSAYEILRQYLDSLKRYFAREDGADEIVGDIESRIAELFQDKLKKGAHCITDEDVEAVKASMGTPEQFEEDATTENAQHNAGAAQGIPMPRPRKRLYRDPDNKVLGGVCSGLGAYLNVDPVVFRIIFALLAIGGFGSGILVYFILWIATPEANTAAEKLEMRGERVDLNNIRATVQDEINAMKGQFKTVGNDIKNFSQGRGRQVGNDIERIFRNFFTGLGKVLLFVTKGFFYFLAVVILFCLIVAGIAIAASSAALFPLKSLLLSTPFQNTLFWPAVILLIGIPVVALVIFLIRKLTGVKQTNRYVGYTLSFLWVAGLLCGTWLIISIVKDFRTSYREKETYPLVQPSKGKLVIKKTDDLVEMDDVDFFEGGLRVTDDTAIIDNIRVKLEKSTTDSFQVEVVRSSRGRTVSQAKALAREIQFQLNQQDSLLYLPAGISIPRNSHFREQRITVVVRVPVGKDVEVDRDAYHHYRFIHGWNDDWWDNWDDWDHDGPVELKMTIDGLDNIHIEKRSRHHEERQQEDSLQDHYRYQAPRTPDAPEAPKAPDAPEGKPGSVQSPAAAITTSMELPAVESASLIVYSVYNMLK
ncbi:MAG TPA: PspC domain-containing protein [Chitinophaga sp.]|uniref:PspC domain-containing protein n=1 Tax=Chitinophaga sp. TaxID=1869181 RepID=UPI002DB8AF62|nr:PspC domain-containing protein [Chitinophaga sp.]HEU4553829.1 PspC domain-containing protein [Chitinophaga sp.]